MLIEKLQKLNKEHLQISEQMRLEHNKSIPDELSIHRLRKQQQVLQDQISELKTKLHPDIIA